MNTLSKLAYALIPSFFVVISSHSVAQIRSIDDCAVHQKTEMREGCLGTGIDGDSARDAYLTFYKQCNVKIGVKVCFTFPDGSKADSTDYIRSGETEKIFRCTKRGAFGRLQPSPSSYFVWNAEEDSGSKYNCD